MSQVLRNVELVMWSLGNEKPAFSTVRAHLESTGLNQERAAEVPESTAFRRAADSIAGANSGRTHRIFNAKKGEQETDLRCQVSREVPDGDGGITWEKIGVYQLRESGVDPINGACRETLFNLREAYAQSSTHYTGADISKVIQNILTTDGMGIYSPRKAGGVYFAPVSTGDLLDRVERFASSLGVRFLRYSVPDTDAQRLEIAEAIAGALHAELLEHGEAIAAYNPATKPGIVSNRREAIQQTAQNIERLALYIAPQLANLRAVVQDMLARCAAAAQAAQEGAEAARPRGRRIAGLNFA